MNTFMRNTLLSFRGSCFIPAAVASSFLYASSNSTPGTKISISVPESWRESPSLPWKLILDTFFHYSFIPSGNLALFSSRIIPTLYADTGKENVGVAGDGTKLGGGCLGRDSIANAAARVGPAVVNISVPQGFYGMAVGENVGSGTIIDSNGTILTCAHMVVDFHGMRASTKGKVNVTLQDGRTFEGTVVNADIQSDIAIVKIEPKLPLPAAKLGSSRKIRPGDWVIAVGCPLSLQNTVTAGIVSCVNRKSSDLGLGGMKREYIQTDCAINVGNSGGPLVNVDGEVVGVNIMKVLDADGLSFAIPIDSVSKIIEHFNKRGRVVRPWLGLKLIDLNGMMIAQLKERDLAFPNIEKGVLVPAVTPGSPSESAGFHPGDIIIEFDNKPIESIKEIIEIMNDQVGKPIRVVVKRVGDVTATLTVTPEEAHPDV